jgi:hypothetical protein
MSRLLADLASTLLWALGKGAHHRSAHKVVGSIAELIAISEGLVERVKRLNLKIDNLVKMLEKPKSSAKLGEVQRIPAEKQTIHSIASGRA